MLDENLIARTQVSQIDDLSWKGRRAFSVVSRSGSNSDQEIVLPESECSILSHHYLLGVSDS